MMFEVGDLVFAKLKGHRHPHWPAVVIEEFKLEHQSLNEKSNHSPIGKSKTGTSVQSDKKFNKNLLLGGISKVKVEAACDMFNVKFFGTNQTGIVAADSVVLYNDESVERFNTAKNRKHRFFKDALGEIAEMKSKIELKSSKHLSRITRSAVKKMVNRKRDIAPFLLESQVKKEGECKVKQVEQDKQQLMTDQLDIQQSSVPELDKSSISDHQDITLSSPVANHRHQEDISLSSNHQDISLSSPVANHRDQEDTSLSSPVANHCDQEDISGLNSVTNHQDISLSSPVVNHHNYQDILVSTPVASVPIVDQHNLQDFAVSTPLVTHPHLQDFPLSSPQIILENDQLPDTSVSTPVANNLDQLDISVSSPIKIHHDHQNLPSPTKIHHDQNLPSPTKIDNDHQNLPDTSVPVPIVNHCDPLDISGSITQVNHPLVIVLSRPPHDHQEQLNSHPVVDDEAFLPPSVLSSSPSHHHINSPSYSSFPAVNDEVCSHPIVQSPKHSYDNNEEVLAHEDDHKTSNNTKVEDMKSSEWSPIRKKRKLTIRSSLKLDMNNTSVRDNLDNSFSSWVEENVDESSSSWVEEKLDESSSSWVEEKLDESCSSWVEEKLDESCSSWVEENLDKSCSSWVEEKLDESCSSWVEENLEESFSCEENPCELSWVEPSFPEDLADINKLVFGQNNFNQLDDSYDIKIEVLVSDPNISGSDDFEPRNSDLNILSEQNLMEPEEQNLNSNFLTEQKIPSSDPRYFISSLLTGLIGYIIDAFFDDDFEAYCCDELFSVAQLEEHIKKFHRRTPANVIIKTCEW